MPWLLSRKLFSPRLMTVTGLPLKGRSTDRCIGSSGNQAAVQSAVDDRFGAIAEEESDSDSDSSSDSSSLGSDDGVDGEVLGTDDTSTEGGNDDE